MTTTIATVEPKFAYDVPETARLLSISEQMVWKLLTRGEMERSKIGRRTVILHSEIARFLSES